MSKVPLPDTNCVRVALDYTQTDGYKAGSRFFLSYTGSAPSSADCATLATDVKDSWVTDIAVLIGDTWNLSEVDVLDISSETGLSGQWTGSENGGRSGTPLPAQCAAGVEYQIPLRYRGGKPRMYLPAGVQTDQLDAGHWNTDFVGGLGSYTGNFFTALEALSVGSMGTLQHVNLSYYSGFTNVTNSSGRTRAAPKYRATAMSSAVSGYVGKSLISSQRRRRNATSF
jgi:hypothetical protein